MGLLNDLGEGPVALDACVFIYFIERHPEYLPIVRPVFLAISEGRLSAVTASLSLLEVLVLPLRAGLASLTDRYEELLTHSSGLHLISPDLRLLRVAAHLRAVTRVKTPDAIQVASALVTGCTAFLTNDRELPRIAGLRILKVKDYLPKNKEDV